MKQKVFADTNVMVDLLAACFLLLIEESVQL